MKDYKTTCFLEAQVLKICETIGFGRVMQIASEEWIDSANKNNRVGTGMVIGPHHKYTEPCGCSSRECEWCAGCGWLTIKVKQLKMKCNNDK